MHIVRLVAAAVGILILGAAPAWAHVEVVPEEVPEASTVELEFGFHHGCDGLATDGMDVQVPDGVAVGEIGGPEGWESAVTDDPELGTIIAWTGPAVPDGEEALFPVEVTVPAGAGTVLYFPTVQRCGPDTEHRWVEIPAEGQDPDDLDEPAPAVMLVANPDATTTTAAPTTTTAAPTTTTLATTTTTAATTTTTTVAVTTTDAGEDDDGSAMPLIVGAVAAAGVAGGVVWVVRRRRA